MSIIVKTCSGCNLMWVVDQKLGNYLELPNVSSTGNCRHPKTLDVWYISAMNKSFDLKVWVLKGRGTWRKKIFFLIYRYTE